MGTSGVAVDAMKTVPALRVNAVNAVPIRAGRFVLYWMTACRRTRWNFGLQQAILRAQSLGLPLVVLEALRVGYPWASPRMHRFVMDGMSDQLARFGRTPIAYHPYLEPAPGHGSGLVSALASEAALVVTDELPCFFLPRMIAAAGARLGDLGVRLEMVDSNGLLPLRAADRTFTAAVHFRRFLYTYTRAELEAGATHDPLWNAAQRELRREGRIVSTVISECCGARRSSNGAPARMRRWRRSSSSITAGASMAATPIAIAASSGPWGASTGPGDPSGRSSVPSAI